MEFAYELKIPKERIAVLIGKSGDIKKEIEQATHASIHIDSKEGDVRISGEDSLGLFTAREIIKAIGRGFNPEIAKLILKTDTVFELLQLPDYVGRSKNNIQRLKGRVIGTDGKSRRYIENMTETYISVYGKTIGIIGEAEHVLIAKKAIENILAGAPHSGVFKWLEKKKKELQRRIMLGEEPIELKEDSSEEGQ